MWTLGLLTKGKFIFSPVSAQVSLSKAGGDGEADGNGKGAFLGSALIAE